MSVTYSAGSAIKQNVGELKNWDSWKPGSNHSWLLIAGAMDPPKGVVVSKRRDRGDKFLRGIKWDLANMEEVILNPTMGLGDLFNTVQNNYLMKAEVEMKVKQFLKDCREENKKPVIYYTGNINLYIDIDILPCIIKDMDRQVPVTGASKTGR